MWKASATHALQYQYVTVQIFYLLGPECDLWFSLARQVILLAPGGRATVSVGPCTKLPSAQLFLAECSASKEQASLIPQPISHYKIASARLT